MAETTFSNNVIQDDDEFKKSVQERRDFVETITLCATVIFLINSFITFIVLKYVLVNTEVYSYITYAFMYAENVAVIFIILLVFNKYKF